MIKPVSASKKPHKQHTPEFRQEALKFAERIGVVAAARKLNLYDYRSIIRQVCDAVVLKTFSDAGRTPQPANELPEYNIKTITASISGACLS
jgi:transposase